MNSAHALDLILVGAACFFSGGVLGLIFGTLLRAGDRKFPGPD